MVLFYWKLKWPPGHFGSVNQQANKGVTILLAVIQSKLTIENWVSLHHEEKKDHAGYPEGSLRCHLVKVHRILRIQTPKE